MKAVIFALVFGVVLGLLGADANLPWLKAIAYVLSAWMFVAAIVTSVRLGQDD